MTTPTQGGQTMGRREYLRTSAAVVASATIALAGCSTAVGSVPAPRFPEGRMSDWDRIDTRQTTLYEREIAGRTIEARAHAIAYEDVALRRELATVVGELTHPVSLLAASRIAGSLDLDRIADLDETLVKDAERLARSRFESRVASVGVQNLQRTAAGTVTVDTGETANVFQYVADLPLDSTTENTPPGETEPIPVTGDLLTWRHDGDLFVAGAVYPATELASAIEERRAADRAVDISFDPASYRSAVREILTGVQ